jgi:hypothetical protein
MPHETLIVRHLVPGTQRPRPASDLAEAISRVHDRLSAGGGAFVTQMTCVVMERSELIPHAPGREVPYTFITYDVPTQPEVI